MELPGISPGPSDRAVPWLGHLCGAIPPGRCMSLEDTTMAQGYEPSAPACACAAEPPPAAAATAAAAAATPSGVSQLQKRWKKGSRASQE